MSRKLGETIYLPNGRPDQWPMKVTASHRIELFTPKSGGGDGGPVWMLSVQNAIDLMDQLAQAVCLMRDAEGE